VGRSERKKGKRDIEYLVLSETLNRGISFTVGLNFELGCWLFDLILTHGPSYVKSDYILDLYDAVSW